MDIKGVVKDTDINRDKRPTSSETREKSIINFFTLVGLIVIVVVVISGSKSGPLEAIIGISLGVIILGIGEILRHLHKISNK